ncbi:hypothetical protein [Parasitella parasitica]|uniref:Myosin-binding domain-containing protein n=1 Tax=Parasitella parasitica TaxID=35722 RepID=A0A0B7MSJ8_9FUNG|nr:hypothetical protein [Parasitella parasitica]
MIPDIDLTLLAPAAVVVGLCTAILAVYIRWHETPDKGSSPTAIDILCALITRWIRSFKSLLSFTLSTSEQSIFEEEFKYLIVTSSLFNETPQPASSSAGLSSADQQIPLSSTFESASTGSNERHKQHIKDFSSKGLKISLASANIGSLVIMYQTRSVLPVLFANILACYFIVRHFKRVQIRKIHASALDSMHEIISLSQKSDSMLSNLLRSPILSDDQHQLPHQQQLGCYLSSHFETFAETVQQLQPLIDAHSLSHLRDMYNVKQDIPSVLLEFDSNQYKPEDIDLICSVIGWKRREYLLYLLALDVMSNNRSARYGKTWRQAIQVNRNLVREYVDFNEKLCLVSSELVDSSNKTAKEDDEKSSLTTGAQSDTSSVSEETLISDARCITLMHRVSVVAKHIEDMQAKLFLCKQDTKSLASGRVSSASLRRINKRFAHIDENMTSLLRQWEESKNSLQSLLEDEGTKLKSTFTSLPSPPSSPRDFRQNVYSADEEPSSLMSHLTRSRRYTTSL